MADEKQVIISIDINAKGALDDLKKTQDALEEQKKILDELTKAEVQNTDAIATQTAVVKNLQTEIKARERIAVKAANSESDSYNSLSAQYSLNTIALNKMSVATRTETEAGRNLESETEQIRLKMIALKEATQDHTLKVGRYADANISLKAELKNLNNELIKMKLTGDENSESFKTLLVRLGDIKRAMGDAKDEAKFASSEFKNLDKAVGTLDAISSAASVAVGTTALLGGNAEELEKAFAKLAVMEQTVNAIQKVGNALEKESAFMKTVSAAKTYILTTAQAAYGVVVGTSTGALKAFRLALAATGIGAVVIGIGYLISNWEELTGTIKKNTDAIKENSSKSLLTIEDKVKNINKLNKRQLEDLKGSLLEEKKAIEDSQTEKALLFEKQTEQFGNGLAKRLTDQEANADKSKKFYKEEVKTVQQSEEEKIKNIELALKRIESLTKVSENNKSKIQGENEAQRLARLKAFNEQLINESLKTGEIIAERTKLLQVKTDAELLEERLNNINILLGAEQGYIQSSYLLKQEQLFAERDLILTNTELTEKQRAAITEQYKQYELSLAVQKYDSLATLGEQAFKVLGSLAGKNAKVQKIAAQGENVMATYLGITRALAAPGGPANPMNIASAALMGITGIANAVKIANTPIPGGGGDSGVKPTITAVGGAQSQTATTAAVGQGIITRDTLNNQQFTQATLRPTLVVDDVTYKQSQQQRSNSMGTI